MGTLPNMPVEVWHETVEVPQDPPPQLNAENHRSRLALERLLADPGDEATWETLAHTYDEMAAEWTDWAKEQHWYAAPIAVGLAHIRPVRPIPDCTSSKIRRISFCLATRASSSRNFLGGTM